MKTNKFERIIRQKLESIEPDFQEQDWARMQRYMHAHKPPSLWQQYGSWIGYAAAASVATVMAYLYIGQLSQNNRLTADVKNLQSQIEVIRNTPAPEQKADTIYIVQKEPVPYQAVPDQHRIEPAVGQRLAESDASQLHIADQNPPANGTAPANYRPIQSDENNAVSASPGADSNTAYGLALTFAENKRTAEVRSSTAQNATETGIGQQNQPDYGTTQFAADASNAGSAKTLGSDFASLSEQHAVAVNSGNALSRKMNYHLARRMTARSQQQAINTNQAIAKAVSEKKTGKIAESEKITQAENVVPKLNLKVPYRFGGGFTAETNGNAKSLIAEVVVSKKLSISSGISWLKVKPMEFFTEKIFRDKNRRDFKRSHPGEVPLALEVFNINVNPTLVQIPLTVAFRNELKKDWAYYLSAGTNLNVSGREKISFECRAPNNEYFNQTFDKKTTDQGIFSSVNMAVGLEKSFHPIVVQAEGYLFTYFKPLSPYSHNAGPGVKVKLMYQIGRKM